MKIIIFILLLFFSCSKEIKEHIPELEESKEIIISSKTNVRTEQSITNIKEIIASDKITNGNIIINTNTNLIQNKVTNIENITNIEKEEKPFKVLSSSRLNETNILLVYEGNFNFDISNSFFLKEYNKNNYLKCVFNPKTSNLIILGKTPIDKNYDLFLIDNNNTTNMLDLRFSTDFFNLYQSDKQLGLTIINDYQYTFRLYSPRAQKVLLCIFNSPYTETEDLPIYKGEKQYPMTKDENGVWEITISKQNLMYKYYGYRVFGPEGRGESFNPNIVVADPYSIVVTSRQSYPQKHLSIIINTKQYMWSYKKTLIPKSPENLIFYEGHIRDLTYLDNTIAKKGCFDGLNESGKRGGLGHINRLGANAIILQPVMEYDELVPFYNTLNNTNNPFGKTHRGYNTTFYMAPEAYYAEDNYYFNEWISPAGTHYFTFKSMIDSLVNNKKYIYLDINVGFSSDNPNNPFYLIDKRYYFRVDRDFNPIRNNFYGYELNTSRAMVVKYLIDTMKFWIDEYRVDGFRLMFSDKLSPYAIDKIISFRNSITNAYIIFDSTNAKRYYLNKNISHLIKYHITNRFINLTEIHIKELIENSSSKDVNTIDTFLDYSLADLLRLNNTIDPKNIKAGNILSKEQEDLLKLSALLLFSLRGTVNIYQGQDIASYSIMVLPNRFNTYTTNTKLKWSLNQDNIWEDNFKNKWPTTIELPFTYIRTNYNYNNESSWIDWTLEKDNSSLFDYYKKLVEFRLNYSEIINNSKLSFINQGNNKTIAFTYGNKIYFVFNFSDKEQLLTLPKSKYNNFITKEIIGENIKLSPFSGQILISE